MFVLDNFLFLRAIFWGTGTRHPPLRLYLKQICREEDLHSPSHYCRQLALHVHRSYVCRFKQIQMKNIFFFKFQKIPKSTSHSLGSAKAVILVTSPECIFLFLVFSSSLTSHILGITDNCFHLGACLISDLLIMSRTKKKLDGRPSIFALLYKSRLCSIVMEQMPVFYKMQAL